MMPDVITKNRPTLESKLTPLKHGTVGIDPTMATIFKETQLRTYLQTAPQETSKVKKGSL